MLDEQQHVLLERAGDSLPRDLPLQLERAAVGNEAEALDPQLARSVSRRVTAGGHA